MAVTDARLATVASPFTTTIAGSRSIRTPFTTWNPRETSLVQPLLVKTPFSTWKPTIRRFSPKIDLTTGPGKSWFKRFFTVRTKRLMPFFGLVVGERDSGKSTTSIKLGGVMVKCQREEIKYVTDSYGRYMDLTHAEFHEETIYFDTSTIPAALDFPPDAPKPGHGKPYGTVILSDEPIGYSSHSWNSPTAEATIQILTAGRITMKHFILCSPHFMQLNYGLRVQLEPIVIKMLAPGICTFYKVVAWFDRAKIVPLQYVGGRWNPRTGAIDKIDLPEDKQLMKRYTQKKDEYLSNLVEFWRDNASRLKTPYTSREEREKRDVEYLKKRAKNKAYEKLIMAEALEEVTGKHNPNRKQEKNEEEEEILKELGVTDGEFLDSDDAQP